MGTTSSFHARAELLYHILVQKYLIEQDFEYICSILHKDITWFGPGKFELCQNYEDAQNLLHSKTQVASLSISNLHEWHKISLTSEHSCMLYGEINANQQLPDQSELPLFIRFSLALVEEGQDIKLFHAHFSAPNLTVQDNFIKRPSIEAYNTLLENKLVERTQLLNTKTKQLETITNNICGGIRVCDVSNNFSIYYINPGFTAITGYTMEDLAPLNYQYTGLIHPDDIATVAAVCPENITEPFSIEYRLIKKDGSVVWVIDNGTYVKDDFGHVQMLSILTDISLQKYQEEALKIGEKRYEIAIRVSGVTMFEYDILTKDLIFFNNIGNMYGVGSVLHDGPESMLRLGNIDAASAPQYREMYRKIHAGEPFASCVVMARDKDSTLWYFELALTTVYDSQNNPVRAIGIRKNVSDVHQLLKEQGFAESMTADKAYLFEADISNNHVLYVSDKYSYLDSVRCHNNFANFLYAFCQSFVHQDYTSQLLNAFSISNLTNATEKGNKLVQFEYSARFGEDQKYSWHMAYVNILKDTRLNILYARFYTQDISQVKQKEQQALEEQLLYETMISKAILSYEINLTQNLVIRGHENWNILYKIEPSGTFSEMMVQFAQKCVHPEDAATLLIALNRDGIIRNFQNGRREFSVQYRRIYSSSEFHWVNYTMHIFEDPATNDIKGYAYLEDIDEQKKLELALKYSAEHDKMTDLYNKKTTEQLIDDFLESPEGTYSTHAFFMIDIDNFKNINDQLGHLVGDKALVDIARIIRSSFRDCDIVGRIGGDEFAVLMKDAFNRETVATKARELCGRLSLTYTNELVNVSISASIGVAFYNTMGQTYMQLYSDADTALYNAKNKGKNGYQIS